MTEFITKNKISIFDLPHEMLMAIFNKLNKIDVFYSMTDVNQYMDTVIMDPLYVHDLNFTRELMQNIICPIEDQILNKICEKILPKINDQVKKLTLEPNTAVRILSEIEYPNLDCLSFVNFHQETLLLYFTDDKYIKIRHLFINQIKNLQIETYDEVSSELDIFPTILSSCKHLKELYFNQFFNDRSLATSISDHSLTNCLSTSLIKLTIYVNTFEDCLYLLDGCLPCLSTLIIHVLSMFTFSSNISNMKQIPKLKCFSLESYLPTFLYDNQIVPLLQRMLNLEELILFVSVIRYESSYIDGNDLYDNIFKHMSRLNRFTFSITTFIDNPNRNIYLASNNEIQDSFIGKYKQKVGSYVHTLPAMMKGECRIYSLPYHFKQYLNLSNAYSSDRFDKVQCLLMFDTEPFEYNLFKIISQDFPFLRKLTVLNRESQEKKKHSYVVVTFHYLEELSLNEAHVDYVEQFLLMERICSPRLSILEVKYESLANVTNNFTNDASRQTCAQLKQLLIEEPFVCPKQFHEYFPLL